jgi:hypothetical protein
LFEKAKKVVEFETASRIPVLVYRANLLAMTYQHQTAELRRGTQFKLLLRPNIGPSWSKSSAT